jgi:prepilin-type N-terminal cleavage/methylation domain-containing protein
MRARDVDAENGFSLVEVLVTIVIVGVTFSALLGGLITTIIVSSLHRHQATADSVARSAAEWIKDGTANANPFQPCATNGSYSFSGLSVPTGYSVAITGVENWDWSGPPVTASFVPTFSPSAPGCTNHGLQRITIVVTSSDAQVHETVQVLKRVVS